MYELQTERTNQTAFPGYALCCILIGGIFLFFPGLVVGMLSLVLGLLCIAYGVWKLFSAWKSGMFSRIGATLGGAAAIAVGIYIICRPQKIFSLLPLAAGIFFLLDGIERIRCAAVMHRTVRRASNKREAAAVGRQKRRFYSACIIGVVTVLCGVLMLWNPFGALELTLRVCGALILCNGIGASWTSHALKMTVGQFGGDTHYPNHGGAYETEFRDITDTVK